MGLSRLPFPTAAADCREWQDSRLPEACANVIEHAYGPEVVKEVSVRATLDDDTVQIDVVDTGKGFDPAAISPQNLEQLVAERKSGGLGMRLIKTLMDEVHYEMIPGQKNELRMIKRLKKQGI